MTNLCFRKRRAGATAQLVRHVYSTDKRRSVTVNVGTIRLDADVDGLPYGLRLAEGQVLSDEDHRQLRQWLAANGDQVAAARRAERDERMYARARELVLQEQHRSPLEVAEKALVDAAEEIASLSKTYRDDGVSPRDQLRARYLAVYRAWVRLLEAAQAAGVAKIARRDRA